MKSPATPVRKRKKSSPSRATGITTQGMRCSSARAITAVASQLCCSLGPSVAHSKTWTPPSSYDRSGIVVRRLACPLRRVRKGAGAGGAGLTKKAPQRHAIAGKETVEKVEQGAKYRPTCWRQQPAQTHQAIGLAKRLERANDASIRIDAVHGLHELLACRIVFFQAEDGIRDIFEGEQAAAIP